MIYFSLFIFCLSLGTFFPFASEAYLVTLLLSGKYDVFLLLFFASFGNILGSVISWVFGYFVNFFKSGNQVSIKVLFLDNREATITYSLSGFTAGYKKLSSVETN